MAEHPSNILYSGKVTDFHEAMRLLVAQVEFEEQRSVCCERESQHYRLVADEAKAIYRQCMNGAEQLAVDVLRKRSEEEGDELFWQIAEALESGDYSGLAI